MCMWQSPVNANHAIFKFAIDMRSHFAVKPFLLPEVFTIHVGSGSTVQMSIARRGVSIAFIKLVNSGLGFCLAIFLAITFGAETNTDALFVAMFVPVIVGRQIARILRFALVPCLIENEDDPEHRFISVFVGWWFVLSFSAALLLLSGAPAVVSIISPGFDAHAHALATDLLRILAPCLLFFCLFASLQAFFHARRRFFAPEIAQTVWRVVALSFLLCLGKSGGVEIYAYGLTLATVAQFGLCIFLIRSPGLAIPARLPKRDMAILRPLLKGMSVVFVGFLFARVAEIVDRIFASYMTEGSLSILIYGGRLARFLPMLLAGSFFTLLLPEMATIKARGNSLRESVESVVLLLTAVGLPLTAGLFWIAPELVDILMLHGKFSPENASCLAWTVRVLALSVPTVFWNMGLRGIFLVERNLKHIVLFGLLTLCVHIGGVCAFFNMGPIGLAAAGTLGRWAGALYLSRATGLRFRAHADWVRLGLSFIVLLCIMFLVPWESMPGGELVGIAAGGIVALAVYGSMTYPLLRSSKSRLRAAVSGSRPDTGGNAR